MTRNMNYEALDLCFLVAAINVFATIGLFTTFLLLRATKNL